MNTGMGMGSAAIAVVGVCASLAAGQARFEAGYQFNDEAEVVRVESTPFRTEVETSMRLQRTLLLFPFAGSVSDGIANVVLAAGRDRDGGPETRSLGWAEVTFSDVVFESSGTEPIDVGFTIQYGSSPISVCCLETIDGAVWRDERQFELAGDLRVGGIVVTVDPPRDLDVQRTGIVEGGFPPGGLIELTGFRVPVNTPVELRMRVTKSIDVPETGERWNTSFTFGAPPDLAFDDVVFDVPDGVTVQSGQLGIRDNQRVRCIADLERDGELNAFDFLAFLNLFDAGDRTADFDLDGDLTVFDFLAFQNAFDAGCP
ncbi:MAG: GC-type dockerin domain-anchored protein [Planctomycetota bacterium]